MSTKLLVRIGVSSLAFLAATPVLAQATASEESGDEIIVTAQRREESLQKVPIAVSAFNSESLKAQKIEGGPDIQTGVPNLTFAQGQRGNNVTIRGIGTKAFSGASDSATGVHFNGAPITDNRLFEMDLYDMERLEVLRGPQGTLYGRNATGGVINVITAKPKGEFEASVNAEYGSFETRKLRGMVNIPIAGERLALRLASSHFDRGGLVTNTIDGQKIDDRHMYSFRATLGFEPSDNLRGYVTWQRFREDDSRLLTGKAVCVADPGPASVGGTAVTDPLVRILMSQGCANARLDPQSGNALPNSLTTFFGLAAYRSGLASGNVFAGQNFSPDLDTVSAMLPSVYKAREDIWEGGLTLDLSDALQVNYLGSYSKSSVDTSQEGFLERPGTAFLSTTFAPGGFVNDPQLGVSNRLTFVNGNFRTSEQHFHELRISSSFKGPFNFSLGGNFMDYNLLQVAGVYSHTLTAFANTLNGGANCAANTPTCIYIDPTNSLQGNGHNYFLGKAPYKLKSYAAFGEAYYEVTPTVKLTAGARFTRDEKQLENIPARLLAPGSGYPQGSPAFLNADFQAVTGRLGLDWRPDVSFSDSTMFYGFLSRGYKGGGLNPVAVGVPTTFQPEYVNALEIGTKNTFMGGALTLNASAFYYDYKDYQISKFVNRQTITENVDAEVYGLELESVFRPANGLRFNLTAGLLGSKIKEGRSLDLFNRTVNDPALSVAKNGFASVCVVPTAALSSFVASVQQQPGAAVIAGVSGNPAAMFNICSGTYASLGLIPTQGVETNLAGKELPNAPNWTLSAGAEYGFDLSADWTAKVRGDYYRQGSTFARPYNASVDYIAAWDNLNLSFKVSNVAEGLDVEFYVKNVNNNRAVTDYLFNDDSIAITGRAYLREPRVYAISVSKSF